MKLSERKLLVLTILIPAIVAIALAGVGFFIFNKEKTELNKKIEDVNDEINEENLKLGKMVELRKELKKLEAEQDALQSLLPNKDDISNENFIDTLTRFSREAGVKLNSATSSASRRGPPSSGGQTNFDKISYALKIEGDFFQVINYIYLLETYQRFIKVDGFTVGPEGMIKVGKPTKYTLDLKITSYVYTGPPTE